MLVVVAVLLLCRCVVAVIADVDSSNSVVIDNSNLVAVVGVAGAVAVDIAVVVGR